MTSREYRFAPFRLDTANQCLWRDTEQISLSPKAFSVLLYLVDRPGRLVTKQELLDAVWPDIHVTEGVLKRAVLEIRKALEDPVEEPRYIQTLHRRGYRFMAASAAAQAAPEPPEPDAAIVGRTREFQQLDDWFEDATGASRQVVFIAGEAGLGKTTLVESWMRTLRQRRAAMDRGGVAMARGRCLQQFGSGEPYLPVFEALDQLAPVLGQRLVDHLRARAPTWLLHMPALISLEDRVKLRDEVFGSTRERMLREITDALEALSGDTPLVLAFEDLHWSDPSTIDLLSSIARRTSPARLMILATYRPSDAGGSSGPLRAAQNELELHRQCKVLPLGYLSEAATGEYLATRFTAADAPALARALHQRTNGNPLYVVCLADELERRGNIDSPAEAIRDMVPETLQQMFERQAGQLSDAEQEMLDAAAAAGEAFSVAAVAAALGRDEAGVESQCEALVRRHLILKRGESVRFPDGTESPGYSFLHALCRDALYRRIPAGRRSRLHEKLGKAEERLFAADPKRAAAQLAGHFEFAADFPRAVQYLRLAAEGAAARYSNPEAAQYLQRAFGLVERLPEADRARCRMDLLEQRGLMRMTASDLAGAAADFETLTEEARQAGAGERRIRALLEAAAPLLLLDHRKAQSVIEAAKEAQTSTSDPILGALTEVYRAFFDIYLSGWSQESADLLHASARQADAIPDLRFRSRIAWMEAAALAFSANYAAACEKAEMARGYARKAGVFFDYFVATMYLNWSLTYRGELGRALRVAREGGELARRNGSVVPSLWFTVRKASAHLEAFDAETVLATYEELVTSRVSLATRPASYPQFLFLGMARLGAGDYSGAWEALETIRRVCDEGGQSSQVLCPLLDAQAECKLALGEREEARALAERLVEVSARRHEYSFTARGRRILAVLAADAGDLAAAASHIEAAREALGRCDLSSAEWRIHATAAHVYAQSGHARESEEARQRSRQAAQRIADSLAEEPALQRSFLARVNAELAGRASSA